MNHEVLSNLTGIVTQVHRVSEVMGEIAASSEQQSQGVTQLTAAVEQLNQVTQQTAASSEESASTAAELTEQAAEMQHLVQTFQLSAAIAAAVPPAQTTLEHATPPAKVPEQACVSVGRAHHDRQAQHEAPEAVIPFDDDDDTTILQDF